ncbi:MAG: hypothetical protein RJQ08_03830 [Salinisphaeraceae bacterium]
MSEQAPYVSTEALEQQLAAAKRLLHANEAKDSLLRYIQLGMPDPEDPDNVDKSAYEITPQARLLCQVFEKAARGELKRVAVSVGPQLGKSQVLSRNGPAWFSGLNPRKHLMLGTYNQDFADEFGSDVRTIIRSPYHRQVFPQHALARGSQATDYMRTSMGGKLAFVGVGGSGTGKPADMFVVDDPIRNDDDVRSALFRERLWMWFNRVVFTRCHSGSSIVVVHCLVGDTPVVMADGTEKAIADIVPGDEVLAWDAGAQVTKRVLNHASQGVADVFEVKTGNSTIVGTARHPVLVETAAGHEWRRIGDIAKGDRVVHLGRRQQPAVTGRVSPDDAWLLGFMFGDGWLTYRDTTQRGYKGRTYPRRGIVTCFAHGDNEVLAGNIRAMIEAKFDCSMKRTKFGYYRTEVQRAGRWFHEHGLTGIAASKRVPDWVFGEPEEVRGAFLNGFVAADGCYPAGTNRVQVGLCNPGLTRDMRRLATSVGHRCTNFYRYQSALQPPNSATPFIANHYRVNWRNRTWSEPFYSSPVRSIRPAGRAEVFDIQVEGAECFIADQMVVHNTRWHEDDLIGRLCDPDHPERNKKYAGIADNWTYIDIPAVVKDPRLAAALGLTLDVPDDPLVIEQFGEVPMAALWEARKGLAFLAEARRQDPRGFDALYMGRPAPEDGDYFKADEIVEYSADDLPANLRIYAASDHALKTKEANDATCMIVFGVDQRDDVWILEATWGRINTLKQVDAMLDIARRRRPIIWWAGQDHISGSIGPFLRRRMQETGHYFHITELSERGDKEQKAQAIKGRMGQKKVHFPRQAAWFQDAKKELLMFPNGAHDDFVDALANFGRGLGRQVGAAAPVENDNKPARGTWAHLKASSRAREHRERRMNAGM